MVLIFSNILTRFRFVCVRAFVLLFFYFTVLCELLIYRHFGICLYVCILPAICQEWLDSWDGWVKQAVRRTYFKTNKVFVLTDTPCHQVRLVSSISHCNMFKENMSHYRLLPSVFR